MAEVEEWRDRFLSGAENALRAQPKEDEALREEEINRLKRKVGELTMDLDILREAARQRPTTPGTTESDGGIARHVDSQSVSDNEFFSWPAAGARGCQRRFATGR